MVHKIVIILIFFVLNCQKQEKTKEPRIYIGNLISQKNLNYDYVEGDIIDCRNISVEYLKGNIRGEKNQNIYVNVMKGNVLSGNVKVNILEGNIINGKSVFVKILIGRDFSKLAKIEKHIKDEIEF
ncbi:MAG: hypothetical protein ACK4UJ_05150 [Leptonema sp. (in: bacteria)]